MSKIKYSIITPCYNSYHLMEHFFESLEEQTFNDFEVIIVDDCSSDDSYTRLKEYASNSNLNIIVCQTEKNDGPGNARNIGMTKASGEWITFIDNDDWVDIDLLSKVEAVTKKENVNCIIYDYYITNGEETKVARSMYSGERGLVSISDCMTSVRNHTVGKFYKRSNCIDNNIFFPKLKRCEDVAFVCRAIDACGSAYYMKEPMYYYLQRGNSLSNNKKLDEKDMILAFEILEKSLGDKYPIEMKEKSVCDLLYGVLLMMCKSKKDAKEIKKYITEYERKYPEWWKCQSVKRLGKAKELFLLMARYRLIVFMKMLSIIHGIIVG